MSRNQKATLMTSGFYGLALTLGLWGAMTQPETRITGTIENQPIDIPVWQQKDPKYQKIKDAKVSQGWGGLRLLVWGIGAAAGVTGLALSAERRSELERERIEYERNCREEDAQADIQASYNLSLQRAKLQKKGEAQMALFEDSLVEEVDDIRAANGWFAPEPENTPAIAPAAPILQNTAFAGMKTPEQYQAEIELAAEGAKSRLKEDGITGAEVPEDRYKLFSDRGEAILESMADLKMSILNVAPTGGGKTHTLDKWMGDLMALYPQAEMYVIAQKNDPFMGLNAKGRVKIFDSNKAATALKFIDTVHKELERRKAEPLNEREHDEIPVRLILDDWYATYLALQNLPAEIWRDVKRKLGDIVTLGREFNVCLYVCTQSYILSALGLIEDSNIRNNLAIVCQGLVKVKAKGKKQGTYQSLQQIITNAYITPNKEDRQRIASEIQEVIELSKKYGVPAVFSAIDESTLALMPRVTITLDEPSSSSTIMPVADSKEDEEIARELRQLKANFETIEPSDTQSQSQAETPTGNTPNNDSIGIPASEIPQSESESPETESQLNPEFEGWYKWLPSKVEVIKLLEDTDGEIYTFTSFVRSKLKKTETEYHKKSKNAVVELLLTLERFDLITKYKIDTTKYPIE